MRYEGPAYRGPFVRRALNLAAARRLATGRLGFNPEAVEFVFAALSTFLLFSKRCCGIFLLETKRWLSNA